MRALQLVFAFAILSLSGLSLWAQTTSEKDKSPADLAADEFVKFRDDKEAAVTAQRLQKLSAMGFDYLTKYPTHRRVSTVVNSLASFGTTLRAKELGPMREYWGSVLAFEFANRKGDADMTVETRMVLASLEAAMAVSDAKEVLNKKNLFQLRTKIDALAPMKGSSRFLDDHEREFVLLVYEVNAEAGEAEARKLLDHRDKKVVAMARNELKLMHERKVPLDMSFTSLDNKPVDLAKLRGKVVVLYFWSATSATAEKDLDSMFKALSDYRRNVVDVVTINIDEEAQRTEVTKFIKENRIKWPVVFDGKGKDGEAASRLAVTSSPSIYVIDKQGMLKWTKVRTSQLASALKREVAVP